MPKEMETYHICIHKFIGKMPENVNSGKVIVCAVEGCQKAHISSDILNWNQRDSISLAFVNEAGKRGFDGIVMCYSFSHWKHTALEIVDDTKYMLTSLFYWWSAIPHEPLK